MNGVLVVNHFLRGEKFEKLHNHLIKTATEMNINLTLKTNLELMTSVPEAGFVLFWDKDINLAKRLENKGLPVFNSARSIELCDDKAKTFLELENIVPQPKTLIAPLTFFKADMSEFIESAAEILGLPLVYKECFGSFGEQVYLCKNIDEIKQKINGRPFLLQEFIEESAGEDIRIEVAGGECVSAVKRKNKNDFRSNVTNGGEMRPFTPTEIQKEIALTACKKLGLTFGGVDILNENLLCEVNSNAHIINIMESNGLDIAPIIFKTIGEKIK